MEVDPDDIAPPAEAMDVDTDIKPKPRVRDLDENYIDDEDLQAVLSKQRRERLRKARPLGPDQVAMRSGYILLSTISPLLTPLSSPSGTSKCSG